MSFVKTLPEALAAASSQLEGLGTSMAAENAAAAGPTTAIAPAASDEVSALQAGIFSTYGQLYQTASAQAQAIHQQFVSLLAASAGSYGETEAANQAVAASTPLTGLGSLVGASSAAAPAATPATGLGDILQGLADTLGSSPLSSPFANLMNIQVGNWASAGSDLIGMAGGGLLTALPEEAAEGGLEGGLADLAGSVSPAGVGGAAALGGAPVVAGVGQASSVGGLSVPPSWAGEASAAGTPVRLAAHSWTTAAPDTAPVATMPAGMPSVASAGRGGYGFGAPRYGVKPKVMPKPTV
ncbi:PE family protein [Mycobacterium heckeshornense]|uniref:PPE family protein, SVP subgroup n=1 Tax=Mycobacterium heckeshornense TaxID=110505 RepID=UPI0006621B88|nr:PE domain-containing protein [Mycobacterium heckeshornense]KMV23121.1 PE family protein [Mycobacterium heckeshornense]MCV7035191.1 PE domain-containing protein [Mycobacterium heckeshornense]PIJ34654.1 PE family protein [Mycobacterium heckeshornense]